MGLIIDLFAGGGGASTGIERALGRAPDVAINHNPRAIAFHQMNHPQTVHLTSDVWHVDPMSVRPGEPVDLLWASPDCKHFSKAKGGAPLDRNIRDLAWVVVDWAEKRRPDSIFVENVAEFVTWCIVGNDGQPVWELKGQIYDEWKRRLRACGYRVEARTSRACLFGAPTIRERLCVIARLNAMPVWPKARFGDPKTYATHKLPKWRTTDHVIDWTLPCPSIFASKQEIKTQYGVNSQRPLAPATLARVARGVKRYVLDAAEPFLVSIAHGYSGGRREYSLDEPMGTLTGSPEKAVVAPSLIKYYGTGGDQAVTDPLHTLRTKPSHLLVESDIILRPLSDAQLSRAREVAEFLRGHGAWAGGEFVTLAVRGVHYVMIDVGVRMLVPRELFNAQGFLGDTKLGDENNIFTKTELVGFAGNSCSPDWVEAHVAANCGHLVQFREAAE